MVCGRGGGRDLARACLRWDRTEAGLWTVQHQAQLLLLVWFVGCHGQGRITEWRGISGRLGEAQLKEAL